ncbi:FUSC family protein [Oceanirhabdus seepicola]|uniref:FUSC family protein n=1 Tax=Oceanirhabdus seepicola TaxID=2828781 RepID=A0A9J6P040_9CLOT|nr:FUSC family protein [Oceanirhabdus seepicola]MCM1988784.1 FUSC family protein [Oceanirhabdus seepicola]
MEFINNTLNLQFNKLDFNFGLRYSFIFLLSLSLNSYLFGINISLIGALITLLYFIIPNKNIKVNSLSKITYIYLNIILVTFLGYLATINFVLSLLINLLVPFVIVCLFSDETNISGYSFYYCLFITIQVTGITLKMFNLHLISTFLGLIIGYVFNEVIWSNNHKSKSSDVMKLKKYFVISLKSNYIKFKNGLNLDLLTSTFAFRLSITTAFSFIFWKYLNIPKWYWLSLATCNTLAPIHNQINSRAFKRIKGSIIGVILFLICYFLVNNLFISSILTVLSILLMISYIPCKHLTECYVFSTYMALSFSIVSLPSVTAASYRISNVLVGCFIAIIFNKLIFPNK